MSPETTGMAEPADSSTSGEFLRAFEEARRRVFYVNAKPFHLPHDGAMLLAEVPLYELYAIVVSAADFRAARTRESDGIEVINARLLRSGCAIYGRLPDPSALIEQREPDEEPLDGRPTEQRGYLTPFEEAARPLRTSPVPRNAPEGHVDRREVGASRFAAAHNLPKHRRDRPSQTPEGRRIRTIRAKAKRLGITETEAERMTLHYQPRKPKTKP